MGEFYLALNEGGQEPAPPVPPRPQPEPPGPAPEPFPWAGAGPVPAPGPAPAPGLPLFSSLHPSPATPHWGKSEFLPPIQKRLNGAAGCGAVCRRGAVCGWPPLSAARGTRNCLWTTLLRLVRFLSLPKARRNLPRHLRVMLTEGGFGAFLRYRNGEPGEFVQLITMKPAPSRTTEKHTNMTIGATWLRHSYFLADGTVDPRYYQYVYDAQGK